MTLESHSSGGRVWDALAPLSFSDSTDCLIRAATDPAWAREIINVGR